jgi:CHAD domain-containing protein
MAKVQPEKSVAENCLVILPRLIRRYFKRGRRLVRSQAADAEMHAFRIRTKRIRYVTELYADLYPRPLEEALSAFRKIQEILGDFQDQRMVVEYFERRLMDVRTPGRQTEYWRMLHRARVRQARIRQVFLQHWKRLEQRSFEKRLVGGIEKATGVKKAAATESAEN